MKRYPAAIVATCVIPWNEKFGFMEDLFRKQVRAMREGLTRHLYIFGTAGEGYAVSNAQFQKIARVFREETNHPDTHAMVGAISLSLPTIIERIEMGRELGFRAFQISLPAWGALTDKELVVFFRETCGRFADCKFLHYNLMRTKRLLTGDDYARLAKAHPNLVAVKNGSDDRKLLTGFLTKAPEIQFCIGEFGYAMMRDQYECGLLISLAATNHAMAHKFFNARGKELQKLGKELRGCCDVLFKSVKGMAHMDGTFDKMLYKLHDLDFPLRLLPPYESVTDKAFQSYRKNMPKHWLPD